MPGHGRQVDRKWVIGVEADIQATGERGRSIDNFGTIRVGPLGVTASSNNAVDFPWFGTFRGRAGSERQARVGWTAGAGIEKKFTPNWSAKLEYIYIDLGTKTYFGGTANAVDVRFNDHIVRAGFNYQWSPAVVAKY